MLFIVCGVVKYLYVVVYDNLILVVTTASILFVCGFWITSLLLGKTSMCFVS